MKTAIDIIIQAIQNCHDSEFTKEWILSQCEEFKLEEREQIVSAWIAGNREGWEMTTDWPQDGERHYEEKYTITPEQL